MKKNTEKKKKLPESNVIGINTNPKFKLNATRQMVTEYDFDHIDCFTLGHSKLGFAENDVIFYRTVFDFSEIKENTLCLVETRHKTKILLQNPEPTAAVLGIVEYFQREVAK